jgi:Mycoplasma protein of unknown function, DUF285
LIPLGSKFQHHSTFNGNIESWDVSNVKSMDSMFFAAFGFNRDLSQWKISSLTNADQMFSGATTFNSDLSAWDGEQQEKLRT